VAYWDTESSGPVPQILGQIQGTPTIKLVKPKRKGKNNKQKNVLDYQMERKAHDLKEFALQSMPNFVESPKDVEDFERIRAKAKKYGLPLLLVFSSSSRTINEFKYLSTEYRRRVLVVQVSGSNKKLKELFFRFGVILNGNSLLAVPPTEEGSDADDSHNAISYDGKYSLHRLQTFFSEHALDSEVKPKSPTSGEEGKKDEPNVEEKKQKVKTEL